MILLVIAAAACVQEVHPHAPPPVPHTVLEIAQRPVTLRTGIGSAHDPVGTKSAEAQAFYDQAIARAPGAFAAHHYLTHAYENTGRVAEALAEGATYAKMAPRVPHARHVHGHNLRRAGRIDEAIAEFLAADALASAYFTAEQVRVEYDWHYQHNLDLRNGIGKTRIRICWS